MTVCILSAVALGFIMTLWPQSGLSQDAAVPKKDAWENQRNEATEASNRISQLIEKKKYVEKRAKKTEERTIEAANKIDTVNKELLNILKNDDIAEKLWKMPSVRNCQSNP